jgi:hypothetical protein
VNAHLLRAAVTAMAVQILAARLFPRLWAEIQDLDEFDGRGLA